MKEKLNEQGYKWEEPRDQTGLSWIYLKDKVQFSGYYFENLTYYIFDAKVAWIILSEEYPSKSAAQKDYNEIALKLIEKYRQFKTGEKKPTIYCIPYANIGKFPLSTDQARRKKNMLIVTISNNIFSGVYPTPLSFSASRPSLYRTPQHP